MLVPTTLHMHISPIRSAHRTLSRVFSTRLLFALKSGQGTTNVRSLSMTAQRYGKLEGKVALVTASTEGIGFAIAKDLGLNGAKVYISSRKSEKVQKAVEQLSTEIDVVGSVCHAGKADDRRRLVDKVVQECGSIDILVANAAANPAFGPIINIDEGSWDKIFDVNVKSSFFLAKECVPHMEKAGGSIIFVTSIAGYQPMPFLGAYSVSKTALLGLTKVLANELAPMNIRVNGLAPGVIKTSFSRSIWSNESIQERVLQMIPQRRMGNPDDIGPVASFLASDDARYITGEILPITGGMQSRL